MKTADVRIIRCSPSHHVGSGAICRNRPAWPEAAPDRWAAAVQLASQTLHDQHFRRNEGANSEGGCCLNMPVQARAQRIISSLNPQNHSRTRGSRRPRGDGFSPRWGTNPDQHSLLPCEGHCRKQSVTRFLRNALVTRISFMKTRCEPLKGRRCCGSTGWPTLKCSLFGILLAQESAEDVQSGEPEQRGRVAGSVATVISAAVKPVEIHWPQGTGSLTAPLLEALAARDSSHIVSRSGKTS